MTKIRFVFAALAAAALAGCSSVSMNGLEQALENRLACAEAGDVLFVVSQYGPFGITSKIADADRRVRCGKP